MSTYLIVSDSLYTIQNKIKSILEGITNVVTFNMEENTIDDVLTEASYFSMFMDKKGIVVKNAKMFGTKITENDKKDLEKLEKYLNNENKESILIFTYMGTVDTRKKVFNTLKENNRVFLYKTFTKTELKNEIKDIINKEGYTISDDSLWYIVNNSLGNFDLAINEVNKLFLYYNKPCKILHEDVVNLVSHTIEDNNFKLVDSIIKRDLQFFLSYLKESEILKVEPSQIISLLYREFKLMLSLAIYDKNKYNNNDFSKEFKLMSWQIDKIRANMRLYNMREMKEEIQNLSELDYKYKSGKIPRDVVLIKYIISLCC